MSDNAIPIVVDLDGTLIYTDMLHETALRLFRDDPAATLQIPRWLAQSKAVLKERISERVQFDASALPYNIELIEWLKAQKEEGRTLVLCTASDQSIAQAIASHLNIFDAVIASDGVTNLAGTAKAEALEQRYGRQGFDYAGNSPADLSVWPVSRQSILVNTGPQLSKEANKRFDVAKEFPKVPTKLATWAKLLRLYQWQKNLLLFVPLLAAHELTSASHWISLLLAFFSFSLCASSVYIANDMLDLESDRLHPRKRQRPLASGAISVVNAMLVAPILLAFSLAIGSLVDGPFLSWLMLYFALTCAYSWFLKRIALIDCITLSLLYTLRIIAGTAAAGVATSFWLLAVSVFMFLSLAFLKRFAELNLKKSTENVKIPGRGYFTSDAPMIQTLGVAAGYAAVTVLALYLNSATVKTLYQSPEMVWGTVPLTLFWISWMWMQAHRGKMHDDPLVFAVRDRSSLIAGGLFVAVLSAGALDWPW